MTDTRPRALDAFCGEGGATVGLMRAGYHVTAIDNAPARLKHNPADVKILVQDAVPHIAEFGSEFDFIWASPSCQSYSAGTRSLRLAGTYHKHPRMIGAVRAALGEHPHIPHIIENVAGAKSEMVDPLMLCGTEFGLTAYDDDEERTPLEMWRHRLFESNVPGLVDNGGCRHHEFSTQVAGAYGGARRDKHEARFIRKGGYVPSAAVQAELLGIDWMTQAGLFLSIPPVYSEHLARQVLAYTAAPPVVTAHTSRATELGALPAAARAESEAR